MATTLPPGINSPPVAELILQFLAIEVPENVDFTCSVSFSWWGQEGANVISLAALSKEAVASAEKKQEEYTVRFPVCTSPNRFVKYLDDMVRIYSAVWREMDE